MIKLQSIRFHGLNGFGTLELEDLGRVTSLTGPNGSGKTTILKVLDQVFGMLGKKTVCDVLPDSEAWHRSEEVALVFQGAGECALDAFGGHFLGEDGTIRVEISLDKKHFAITAVAWGDASIAIERAPSASAIAILEEELASSKDALRKSEDARTSLVSNRPVNDHNHMGRLKAAEDEIKGITAAIKSKSEQLEAREQVGVLFGSESAPKSFHRDEVDDFLKALPIPSLHYVNPLGFYENAIPDLVKELVALKVGREVEVRRFNDARARLSHLIQSDVDIWAKNDAFDMHIRGVQYKKASSGTKVSIAFFGVTRMEDPNRIIVWDEPENGLHPTRRAMVLQLMLDDERQYFVATHASEFVPFLHNEGKAFRCDATYTDDAEYPNLSVRHVADRRDAFEVLEALGVHPARTLFTASVVIWVEGPTELLFYRHWLGRRLEKRRLVEGFHYTFMQYGGSLISYLSVADEIVADSALDVLSICRHPVVLVDSDFKAAPEGAPQESLKGGARKLLAQIDAMNASRDGAGLFQWTAGREIENYLPGEAILHAASQVWSGFKHFESQLNARALTVGQFESYEKALEGHVIAAGATDEGKAQGRTLWGAGNKVEMMRAALGFPDLVESELLWDCTASLAEIEAFVVTAAMGRG